MKFDNQKATSKQVNYLEILFNDIGWASRENRLGWLSMELNRKIQFLDELTVNEASRCIGRLKEIKESQKK